MNNKYEITQYNQQTGPKKIWLYLNVALALTLIAVGASMLLRTSQQSLASKPDASNNVGQPQADIAPEFTLISLTGENVALSDYAGQVVMINMWATWCPPCKAEMPEINAFYEAHKQEGFVVLAVNNQEDAITINEFIQANGFTFPVLLDTQTEVVDLYRVQGLPTSFIIDRNGFIQHTQIGEITLEELEAIVGPLL